MENSIGAKRKAQELVRKGQIQEAIECMRSVLTEGEPDPYDHVYVGDLLMRVGDPAEAVEVYLVAVRSYEGVGLYRNAIAIGKKILRIDKGRPDVNRTLADLYDQEGLKGEALPHYLAYLDSFSGDSLPPSEFLNTLERAADSVGSKAEVALRLAEHFDRVKRGDRAADLLDSVADLLEEGGTPEMSGDLRVRAGELRSASAESGQTESRPVGQVDDLGAIDLSAADDEAGGSQDVELELLSLDEGDVQENDSGSPGAPEHEVSPVSVSLDAAEVRAALDFEGSKDTAAKTGPEPGSSPDEPGDSASGWDPSARDIESGSAAKVNGDLDSSSDEGGAFVVEHFPVGGSADDNADGPEMIDGSETSATTEVAPEIPENPEIPEIPEMPKIPEIPEIPETPEIPEIPEIPKASVSSRPADLSVLEEEEEVPEKIWDLDEDVTSEDEDVTSEDEGVVYEIDLDEETLPAEEALTLDADSGDLTNADGREHSGDKVTDGDTAASKAELPPLPASASSPSPSGTPDLPPSKPTPRPVKKASQPLDADVEERLRGGLPPSKQAEAAMARGRWAEARTLLQELHHQDSQNTSTLSKLVEVSKHLGDVESQVQYLCLLGDVWISRGELEEALDTFLAVLGIDSENSTAKRRLARFRELGVEGADSQLEKMGAATGSLLDTGMTQVAVKDDAEFRNEDWVELEGLLEEFKDGLKNQMDESDYQGHYDLAVSHHSMGLLEEAIDELEHVLHVEALPAGIERQARELKGSCFMGLCQWREAVHEFREALDKSAGDEQGKRSSLYHLGQALESAGEWQEARDKYQQLSHEAPGFLDVDERLRFCDSYLDGANSESTHDVDDSDEASNAA